MTVEEAEQMLIEWAAKARDHDQRVRVAVAAGVPKLRVRQLTGLGRSTIDRILAGSPGGANNVPSEAPNDH